MYYDLQESITNTVRTLGINYESVIEYAECIYESGAIKIEFVDILDNSWDFPSRYAYKGPYLLRRVFVGFVTDS